MDVASRLARGRLYSPEIKLGSSLSRGSRGWGCRGRTKVSEQISWEHRRAGRAAPPPREANFGTKLLFPGWRNESHVTFGTASGLRPEGVLAGREVVPRWASLGTIRVAPTHPGSAGDKGAGPAGSGKGHCQLCGPNLSVQIPV